MRAPSGDTWTAETERSFSKSLDCRRSWANTEPARAASAMDSQSEDFDIKTSEGAVFYGTYQRKRHAPRDDRCPRHLGIVGRVFGRGARKRGDEQAMVGAR